MSWLRRIEALAPGDACEFRYPARRRWLPGVVVRNGGAGHWQVCDLSDVEGRRGSIAGCLHIEHVRLPGQLEAWASPALSSIATDRLDSESDHAVDCAYWTGDDCDCNWEGRRPSTQAM